MIFEGSCDWSNDAENLALITGINYIWKYIQIESNIFFLLLIVKIFHNFTAFVIFWIK